MKNKILKILKNSDKHISGSEIAKILGVSRTAVWKTISKLKYDGYIIDAVNNKGYLIIDDNDTLNEAEICSALETNFIGKNVVYLEKVSSTNDVIKLEYEKNSPEGTVVIAQTQTAGKGRMGRKWISEKNCGLWFSILLKPNIDPRKAPILTLIAGICVCKACREIANIDVSLKWPNDIIYNNKKICGILTEMSSEIHTINYVIVGIGINVNNTNFPSEISNTATSLKKETNKLVKRKLLLNEILKNFEKYYSEYIKDCDFSKFIYEYESFCNTINKEINVINSNGSYKALAIGITNEGELIVEKENGIREIIFSGEVSIRNI